MKHKAKNTHFPLSVLQNSSFMKIAKYSFLTWILSIVVFFLNLVPYSSTDQAEKPFSAFANIVGYTALFVGIISFLAFSFSIAKPAVKLLLNLSKKHSHLFKVDLFRKLKISSLYVLLVLFIGSFFIGNALVGNMTSREHEPIPTLIPEVSETEEAISTLIPTTSLKPQHPRSSTRTPDPDPVVDCNFKYVGTKKIRSSECSKSFECQIGGQWYIYTSRDKCTQDQAGSNVSDKTALIKVLQSTLRTINESSATYLQDLEKLSDYSEAIIADYEKGLISYEEFKTRSDKTTPAIKELTSWIEENQKKRENYENLIRRFERGENVPMEEFKTLLGY